METINFAALSKFIKWAMYTQILILLGVIICMIDGVSYDVESLTEMLDDCSHMPGKGGFYAQVFFVLAIIACLVDYIFPIVGVILIWKTNKIAQSLNNDNQSNMPLCSCLLVMYIFWAILNIMTDIAEVDALVYLLILIMIAFPIVGIIWSHKIKVALADREDLKMIPKLWLAYFGCFIAIMVFGLLSYGSYIDMIDSIAIIVLLYLARKEIEKLDINEEQEIESEE